MKTIKTQGLTIAELVKLLSELKLGQYHSFTTKKVDSETGYYRITRSVGRLCDYENMESTKQKRANGTPKRANGNNSNVVVVIPNVLYYYPNTNNYNISVKTTKRQGRTSKTKYYNSNGKKISKSEFEKVVKLDNHNINEMWYIKVQDLIAIK